MWKVAGCNVTGASHTSVGLPGQDYWKSRITDAIGGKNRCLIGIADGAGSAAKAEVGAREAIETLLATADTLPASAQEIDRDAGVHWLGRARQQLQGLADAEGINVSEYAATILLAVLEEDAGIFIQLGDGAWIVEREGGEIEAATWPYIGEYVNETVFLTSENFEENVQLVLIKRPINVAGTTDGIQSMLLSFRDRRPHIPIMDKIFRALKGDAEDPTMAIRDLLECDLANNLSDDDKTLVLAWKHGSSDSPQASTAIPS